VKLPGTTLRASRTEEYDYDIFTIGAGSGGVRGSRIAASYGRY
jgi:glutathione reductase (NADPH)